MSAARSRARRRGHWLLAALALLPACRNDEADDAGVGSDRSGCGQAGSHSEPIGAHSCVCEAGYDWCDPMALDDFDCCPIDDPDTGSEAVGPDLPCGADQLEQVVCLEDPDQPGPAGTGIWACNGEAWVLTPGYAAFACLSDGFAFAYGCEPADPEPLFLCGYGPGNGCDLGSGGLCVDSDIIDTCVWGRRTIDRCSRLCGELEVFGPGFRGGNCQELEAGQAQCVCRL